jgi:predicted transposase YbfD/YdcC
MKKRLTKKEKEIIDKIDELIQEYNQILTDYVHTTQKHSAQSSIDTAQDIKNYILGFSGSTEETFEEILTSKKEENSKGWISSSELR